MNELRANPIKASQLRALLAVSASGNFSEAALELDISQSSVSHAIATLEDNLGVSLLVRGRRGARLTPAGEAVIEYSTQALQLLDKIVEAANLHKGLQGGRVRVAAFHSIAANYLPKVIAQFKEQWPQVAITVVECLDSWVIEKALQDGTVDVAFIDELPSAELETLDILHDQFVALLPSTVATEPCKLSWEQLSAYPLISEVSGTACALRLRHYLQSCGVTLSVAFEIQEDSTRVKMVAQGLGAAIIPWLAAQPIPEGVIVCQLPVPLERVIRAAVVEDRLHSPAVYAFLDVLKALSD